MLKRADCVRLSKVRYLYLNMTLVEKIMSAVSIRLPEDVSIRLQSLAQRTGRSKTFYMIEAIQEHIDDLEDLYLAERELDAVRSGESKTTPLTDIMRRYGMEG